MCKPSIFSSLRSYDLKSQIFTILIAKTRQLESETINSFPGSKKEEQIYEKC